MKYLKYIFNIFDILVLIAILLYIYSWRIEPRWVKWQHIDMPIENLPDSLNNKILIQISDIHVGINVDDNFIINTFNKLNKHKPDFVVYTGDFISPDDHDKAPFDQLIHILKHKAHGRLGTLAIFGNHDYGKKGLNGATADSLEKILLHNNIEILRNTSVRKNGLNFIGIDDYWGRNFDPKKAMKNYIPNEPTIVLCHNPDVVDLHNQWNNYQGWILSGHTHGGQVRIPFGMPIWTPVNNKSYDEGLKYLNDKRTLYINRGLGHSLQIRFNARPEITIFKLIKE